jgi:hypothetical protein
VKGSLSYAVYYHIETLVLHHSQNYCSTSKLVVVLLETTILDYNSKGKTVVLTVNLVLIPAGSLKINKGTMGTIYRIDDTYVRNLFSTYDKFPVKAFNQEYILHGIRWHVFHFGAHFQPYTKSIEKLLKKDKKVQNKLKKMVTIRLFVEASSPLHP